VQIDDIILAGSSSSCHAVADIVFVVDSSGSINEHDKGNWDRVKNFASSMVGKLDVGRDRVRVGMVLFGNEGFVQFYLNSHYNVADITEDIARSSASAFFFTARRSATRKKRRYWQSAGVFLSRS